jgi:hypothetical protein
MKIITQLFPVIAAIILVMPASVLSGSTGSDLPEPVEIKQPQATAPIMKKDKTRIVEIRLTRNAPMKALQTGGPLGERYSIAFWLRCDDMEALQESSFTDDAPVTILDWHAKSISDQRVVMRVHGGKFAATERSGSKWKSFEGTGLKVIPGKLYFIVFTYENGRAVFYINGDAALRGTNAPIRLDRLENLVFGHFGKTRKLEGAVYRLTVFSDTLDGEQIRILYNQPPSIGVE